MSEQNVEKMGCTVFVLRRGDFVVGRVIGRGLEKSTHEGCEDDIAAAASEM